MDFGNIAAFIPIGVLIPLLYRTSFIRFIAWFLLSILVLETIQALTLLGSFDVNDVIQNSVGAAIGFGAYKLGMRTENVWRIIAATGISIVVLMIGVWGFCGIVDKVFTKEAGAFVALHELTDSTGNPATGTKPYSFKMGGLPSDGTWAEAGNEQALQELLKNPVWQTVPAVKKGNVYPVEHSYWQTGAIMANHKKWTSC